MLVVLVVEGVQAVVVVLGGCHVVVGACVVVVEGSCQVVVVDGWGEDCIEVSGCGQSKRSGDVRRRTTR